MSRRKTQEEFVQQVNILGNNEYTVIGEYINAKTKIKIKHNKCGRTYETAPENFIRGSRCIYCSEKQRINNCKKARLTNYIEKIKYIKEMGSDIKTLEGLPINKITWKGTSAKYQFKCIDCGMWFSRIANDFFRGSHRCWDCGVKKRANARKMTHDKYLKKLHELKINIIPTEKYKGIDTPINHKCEYCNNAKWKVAPSDILNRHSTKCPLCARNSHKTTEQFKKEVYQLTNNEYSVLSEYKNAKTHILMQHNVCKYIYKVAPSNFLSGKRCPICCQSLGERKIADWLNINNVYYISQYTFNDLLSDIGNNLRFDFAILNNNKVELLIEFDGEQHQTWIKGMMTYEGYCKLQKHDKLKNDYCRKKNIKLLRIPYYEFDNIENILKEHLT